MWKAENDSNMLRVDAKIFASAKKYLREKKFPDTCGHGINLGFNNNLWTSSEKSKQGLLLGNASNGLLCYVCMQEFQSSLKYSYLIHIQVGRLECLVDDCCLGGTKMEEKGN